MFKTRILISIVLLSPPVMAAQKSAAPAYLRDQEIDHTYGLLDLPWKNEVLRLRSRDALPAQMQSGFPPYDQQPEKAQVPPAVVTTPLPPKLK